MVILKMDAVRTSETSVNFNESTGHYIPSPKDNDACISIREVSVCAEHHAHWQ
jgi:hypothetical protein